MARVLVIDDEEQIRSSLKSALERRSHECVTAENLEQGRQFYKAGFDIIFLDIMLPDGNGVQLLSEILSENPNQIIVMISGHADITTAINAIKIGAYDFIEKPLSLDRVLITIDNAMQKENLVTENKRLITIVYGSFIGESPNILKLKSDIAKSASRTTRFLISGENGTGKELVAHMIHSHSQFPSGPFVAVNCAALPSELVESELFGHTAGAFTGASKARKGKFLEADKGTIFLDEISEMPQEAQAKILRAIETKTIMPVGSDKEQKIECNIIAASNKDLLRLVAENKFREDLLYRLNVVKFQIPPLRERKDDIILLADYFLQYFAHETKSVFKKLTPEAKLYLEAFDYPGNIRELKNLMERINIYCDNENITREDITEILPYIPKVQITNLKDAVSEFEKKQIEASINRHNGNISKAAKELGLERSHLYKKMKKLGIE